MAIKRPTNASSLECYDSSLKPINLLRGWPAPSLLPASALQKASAAVLSDPSIFVPALQYGADPGFQPLRENVASWLSGFYGTQETADRIVITGGASQSIACILQSFTDPSYTRAVWMVAPCYFLASGIFADSGFGGRLRAVPEDKEGIDLEYLTKEIEKLGNANDGRGSNEKPLYKNPAPYRKIYRHVIYCVPSFSNPSGKTMSLARRQALVELARKWDALVVADDVYDMLQWPIIPASSVTSLSPSDSKHPSTLGGAILPRLVDIDIELGPSQHDPKGQQFGHAISNGSFSKLSGPGMRTGWVDAAPDFATGIAQTGSTKSGGAPSQFSAAVLCEMLRNGDLQNHIETSLKPNYQRRHARMVDAARRVLEPLGAEVRVSSLEGDKEKDHIFGGYFLWIHFPDGPATKLVADRCREENLAIGYGGLFEVQGDEESVKLDKDIRLCFSWVDEDELVEGVERLGQVIHAMKQGVDDGRGRGQTATDDMDKFK